MSNTLRFRAGDKVRVTKTNTGHAQKGALIGQDIFILSVRNGGTGEYPYLVSKTLNGSDFGFAFADNELESMPSKLAELAFISQTVKIGDKVKIVYKPSKTNWSAISEAPYRWISAMDSKINQEGRIVKIVDNNSYRVRFEDKSTYTFSPISIEVIDRSPQSEVVVLNDTYNGIVTIEGVIIDDGRSYSFDILKQLGVLIQEQKEYVPVEHSSKEPILHLLENGKPDFNKMAYDVLNPSIGDTVKVVASFYQMDGFETFSSRQRDMLSLERVVSAVNPDNSMVTVNTNFGPYEFPALALNYVSSKLPTKSLTLSRHWTAEVHPTHVQIGCQRYEFEVWEKLLESINKFEALKAEYDASAND